MGEVESQVYFLLGGAYFFHFVEEEVPPELEEPVACGLDELEKASQVERRKVRWLRLSEDDETRLEK